MTYPAGDQTATTLIERCPDHTADGYREGKQVRHDRAIAKELGEHEHVVGALESPSLG